MDWSEVSDKLTAFGDRVGKTLKSVFGARNERMVRDLEPVVQEINSLEEWAQGLSGEEMQAQTAAWKKELADGETTLEKIMPKAFALVREASVRTLGLRHFDVQLVGGIVMHRGSIAEMMTGEGKTLVATLPLYLNCLAGKPVYLVTVNDYLAKRDADWMGPIYRYLGVTYGSIQSNMDPSSRHPVYASDIVYGTNNEFGFDYLRDNMKQRVEDQVQRHLSYAIIDEVDSILIDESRTPLIISGPTEYVPDKYRAADKVARQLKDEEHYEIKEKERQVHLLEDGIVESQEILGVESFYSEGNTDWPHYIENALKAHHLYENDKEYVVEKGEVIIVDEFTGRKMEGRRWSDGLHQAVETKENIEIKPENQTLATITFQNYFRLYEKLAGMTGTAITEAGEFLKTYNMDVITIPTHLQVIRDDREDLIYRTEPEKWKAIVEEIEERKEKGQPMLVGTASVENSEKLSGMLKRRGIQHEVLNAKNHAREATIVALAGAKNSVTVSTNMAGRGTDIKLGGNFEFRLKQALEESGLELGDPENLDEIAKRREELREICDADEHEVLELGGLYVLGTERHDSRRIDNQLRGRSGRQGNAGESRFYLSLQDPLMRRFYKDWVTNAMGKLGMSEGVPIEAPMVTRVIQKAQKKVEDYNFEIRKNLLEYDDVMDQQRKTIYGVRQEILEGLETREKVFEMFESVVLRTAEEYAGDPDGFQGWFQRIFGFEIDAERARQATAEEPDCGPTLEALTAAYDKREKEIEEVGKEHGGGVDMRRVEQFLLLRAIDTKWMDHLRAIDSLRAGIGLRGYAQKDPKNEYKAEGFKLFEKLMVAIEDDVTGKVMRVEVRGPQQQADPYAGQRAMSDAQAREAARAMQVARQRRQGRPPASAAFDQMRRTQAVDQAVRRQHETGQGKQQQVEEKAASRAGSSAPGLDYAGVGRNDTCPCGSGKKFKKCHGKAS